MRDSDLSAAIALIEGAVAHQGVPSAVLLVTQHGKPLVRRAFGAAGLRPEVRPLDDNPIYDMASLTKPIATGSALALLLEAGTVRLDDPVGRYLPPFLQAGGERAGVTLRHLATHCAGLPAGGAYANKTVSLRELVSDIAASRRVAPPGTRFLYSDFSAISLGAVIEAVTTETLDRFCRDHVFTPLGMTDTGFRPGIRHAPRCVSTAAGDDTPATRGKVHDPTAAAAQRAADVTGHAGLFATADDLAKLGHCLLRGGAPLWKPETVRLMTTVQSPLAGSERGVLWDIGSDYAIRGELSPGSFGHTGFTGTSIWIDPPRDTVVILLTNIVHAKPQPAKSPVIPLRRQLSTAVAHALRP